MEQSIGAQLGGGRGPWRKPERRVSWKEAGADQPDPKHGQQSRPPCPPWFGSDRGATSDGAGHHKRAGQEEVPRLNPAELTVAQHAQRVTTHVEAFAGERLCEPDTHLQGAGKGAEDQQDRPVLAHLRFG
jgi:hypothetical protein